MIRILFPKLYINSIFEIDDALLKKYKIKAIVFDIDNTLAPFYIAEPDEKTLKHLLSLKEQGYALSLFSNNSKKESIFSTKNSNSTL